MRAVHRVRVNGSRLLAILIAVVVYIVLVVVDALSTFSYDVNPVNDLFLLWLPFAFSAFVALIFLAVGSLVWLYARDRRVALLLFCLSCSTMITFAVETASSAEGQLLRAVSGVSSSLSLTLFAILLLFFPRNYLSFSRPSAPTSENLSRPRPAYYSMLMLRSYIFLLIFLCLISMSYSITIHMYQTVPAWLEMLKLGSSAIVLVGILVTITVSYRQSYSLRERQQQQFFVGGVVLSFAPLLILTVLPQALKLPFVDGQLSTLTVILLPLSLGYSILRYQILVFDTYIYRVVTWIVGVIFLALLVFLIVGLCSVVLSSSPSPFVESVVVIAAVLAPFVWWLAKISTERLFFTEMRHYRRLIDRPNELVSETLDLEEASRLITLAAVNAFQTSQACLFVLDEGSGRYSVCPGLNDDASDAPRRSVVQSLLSTLELGVHQGIYMLEAQQPVVKQLAETTRPLLLSELTRAGEKTRLGLSRYLNAAQSLDGVNALVAPVRAQGKMIGIFVLGEREDHQQYAGPDFEVVQLLLSRFSSILETARLYDRARLHTRLLNNLYNNTLMPGNAFQTIEEIASSYVTVAADAVMGRAEIWLYDEKQNVLQRTTSAGSGPLITELESLTLAQEQAWSSWFYEGENAQTRSGPSTDVPSCLPQTPLFPFVWLSLTTDKQRLGVLVLTYPCPHFFTKEEMRVLEMFARQCAAALQNTRITIELRAAYERQKELDQLKDQFIVTASHELRTPLTAVQGYIELLHEYDQTLTVEARTDFIAKAHRGCDELTLMVGNIMDANRVQVDAENVKLTRVLLIESVVHIVEIVEALATREHCTVTVDVPPTLLVMADGMRLRQVLLNLVGNALKYSRGGTSIEITAQVQAEKVTVCVRDYGSGVPLEDQDRLFERFVRLERDMNSPVRGAGLGLYICKQLVEAMGGRIWVESSGIVGEGSVFAFTLQPASLEQEMPTRTPVSLQRNL